MSVLNWAVVPSRVAGVCRFLLTCPKQRASRAHIEAMMSPPSLRARAGESDEDETGTGKSENRGEMIRLVLRHCATMGLTEPWGDKDSGLVLSEAVRAAFPPDAALPHVNSQAMRRLLRHLVLNVETGANADYGAVLTWFLAQDPLTFATNKGNRREAFDAELKAQFGISRLGVTNNTINDNFAYWTIYLGFAWRMSLTGNTERLVPDPTTFLIDELPLLCAELAAEDGKVEFPALLQRLAALCPAFEGGPWHARARAQDHLPPGRGGVSPALSFALKRLESRGVLRLDIEGDAQRAVLQIGSERQEVAHIRWLDSPVPFAAA